MKKKFAVILALTMAASAFAGYAAVSAEEAAEAEETTEAAEAEETTEAAAEEDAAEADAEADGETYVFKHGFDLDYPPYSYINDAGETSGFDVEMAQAVCDYYGWEYEAVPFNWDAKDAELNAGSCDCIWSGFTMNGREDDYLWSIPYSDNTQMIMVAKDSGIKTLADLAGKTVGVQTSTSAYDMLNDEEGQAELASTFASLEVYETYTIAFNDLKAGAIDAIAIDVTSGNYLMSGEEDYEYLEEELGSEQYAIGFRKDDTELCEKINAALEALAADGTYDEIGKKYPEIYDYLSLNKGTEGAPAEEAEAAEEAETEAAAEEATAAAEEAETVEETEAAAEETEAAE
ncbi:MAG: transporter substrate-binding domain-containing protein [Blautia sp.]|nr:transporter substrate-binding domain-containing protein [Blautia sp.]